MGFDFAVDCELLNELKGKINTAISDIETEKEAIYAGITGLGESWKGESFNTFQNKCDSFKPSIEMLIEILEFYNKQLENTMTKADDLVDSIASMLNE